MRLFFKKTLIWHQAYQNFSHGIHDEYVIIGNNDKSHDNSDTPETKMKVSEIISRLSVPPYLHSAVELHSKYWDKQLLQLCEKIYRLLMRIHVSFTDIYFLYLNLTNPWHTQRNTGKNNCVRKYICRLWDVGGRGRDPRKQNDFGTTVKKRQKQKISWALDVGVCYSITGTRIPYYITLITI